MPYKDPLVRKQKSKEYREKNDEIIKIKAKLHYEENKIEMLEKCKNYYVKYKYTEQRKKTFRICNWKKRGLIGNYDKIYERFMNTDICDNCGIELDQDGQTKKCMDHEHTSGEFRNILCNFCNILRK